MARFLNLVMTTRVAAVVTHAVEGHTPDDKPWPAAPPAAKSHAMCCTLSACDAEPAVGVRCSTARYSPLLLLFPLRPCRRELALLEIVAVVDAEGARLAVPLEARLDFKQTRSHGGEAGGATSTAAAALEAWKVRSPALCDERGEKYDGSLATILENGNDPLSTEVHNDAVVVLEDGTVAAADGTVTGGTRKRDKLRHAADKVTAKAIAKGPVAAREVGRLGSKVAVTALAKGGEVSRKLAKGVLGINMAHAEDEHAASVRSTDFRSFQK